MISFICLRFNTLHPIPFNLPFFSYTIDYVLVYEDAPDDKPQPKASKIHKHEAWRKKFMTNLAKAGLLMEEVNAGFT